MRISPIAHHVAFIAALYASGQMTALNPDYANTEISDADLIARCVTGDAKAWEALVHRYQRLVYVIVCRMGFDEHMAADVFQTVFERLMAHLSKLTDPDRLQAWIVTTTKREALLQLKRSRRNISFTLDDSTGEDLPEWDIADESLLPEQVLVELQTQAMVRHAMGRLDTRCNQLLTMLYVEGDDKVAYEEVSARLDMPIGSIGPTRSRCLEKLRKLVESA
jgi:RNA polymerase sigma factor (sigma-70 family)